MQKKEISTHDRMSDLSFRLMTLTFRVIDFFSSRKNYLEKFGIKKGDTIIDYGCGPGRYIPEAAKLTGEQGKVYAVDIHPLAVQTVNKLIDKKNLKQVEVVLAEGYNVPLEENTADLIYALDMFHMVADSDALLKELNRLIKPGGVLILEDGHQPRKLSSQKVNQSGCWDIKSQNTKHMKCVPK